jgi:hypothetical protein
MNFEVVPMLQTDRQYLPSSAELPDSNNPIQQCKTGIAQKRFQYPLHQKSLAKIFSHASKLCNPLGESACHRREPQKYPYLPFFNASRH